MRRRPRRADAPLLSPYLIWRIFFVSFLFTVGALGVFFYAFEQGLGVEIARTMVVNVIVVFEIFYLFNVRYLRMTSMTLKGALGTPAVLAALGVVIVAQIAFTYSTFMHELFDSRPLGLAEGIVIVTAGVLLMLVLEGEKAILRRLGLFEKLEP